MAASEKGMAQSEEAWRLPAKVALADGSQLHICRQVRLVPGRRLVCSGHWNGRSIYAKLFIGDKAGRDAERDARGVRALIAAGLATPALLFDGNISSGGRALVFAEVEQSESTEDRWRRLAHDPAARLQLMMRLVQTVAAHHQAGLIQRDLYLKNFLITGDAIFSLDGDGIRRYASSVSRRRGLDNLALLLSKFDVMDDVWQPQLLQHYANVRGMKLQSGDLRAFPSRIAAHRLRVAHGYADQKVFRNCTDVIVEHGWSYFKAISRPHDSLELRALLENPEARLSAADIVVLKNGKTCTVLAMPLDNRRIVVKRYNIKNFRHGLSRAWRPSRAAASWANAYRMNILGIATAQPLALLERRWGPWRRQAYYVAEHVDALDAAAFFADSAVSVKRKQDAAENISRLLHKLCCLGLVHGDMKASNVLIGAEEQPLLLDLDAMREVRCKWMLQRGHGRDLRRWMENWQSDPRIAEMMRQALQQVYQNDERLREWLSV